MITKRAGMRFSEVCMETNRGKMNLVDQHKVKKSHWNSYSTIRTIKHPNTHQLGPNLRVSILRQCWNSIPHQCAVFGLIYKKRVYVYTQVRVCGISGRWGHRCSEILGKGASELNELQKGGQRPWARSSGICKELMWPGQVRDTDAQGETTSPNTPMALLRHLHFLEKAVGKPLVG